MLSKSRFLMVAGALMAMPATAALAQQNNPTGNMGSNRSATAAPGTADSKSGSGMHTGDVGSVTSGSSNYNGTGMNARTPGSTGKTVVPGSTSSEATASSGTAEQKTGTTTANGK